MVDVLDIDRPSEHASAVPTGVVTFLFTDIEGSTRILARLGHAKAAGVFDAHDRLLADAFRRNRGIEVRTEGDSFFIAFERASDAVAGALAANRALAAYPWPHGGQVRIRIGMHTGEAAVIRSGYVGLAVHAAARLTRVARGGQVLLSGTTRDLVVSGLSPRAELRDAGVRRLKDLDEPMRVFELVHPTLVQA